LIIWLVSMCLAVPQVIGIFMRIFIGDLMLFVLSQISDTFHIAPEGLRGV
jgi:hypothetical protein